MHSLRGDLHAHAVLDLFAGTGSLGIEALSRGAGSAVFVDNHRDSASLVRKNLQTTGFSDIAEVIQCDVFQAVIRLAGMNRKFDLVFADPPYGGGLEEKLLDTLANAPVLADGALVIMESGAKEEPHAGHRLMQIDRRIYGDTALTFFAITH